jgi:ABC-type Zn uptake system ZnuABC Zn-binding protein ZnuA
MMRLLLVLAICFLSGCGQESAAPRAPGASSLPQVYTVNYPLAWAAQQLAGDQAEVHFPAPAGVDPAFWEPDLATIAAYQGADLILLNGAGYAKWIAEISLPRNRLLDTSGKLQDQLIAVTATAVLMLNVPLPLPPVPQVSSSRSWWCGMGVMCRRIA